MTQPRRLTAPLHRPALPALIFTAPPCLCGRNVVLIIFVVLIGSSRGSHRMVLMSVMSIVVVLYFLFGSVGYYAFADGCEEIITLNLQDGSWVADAVKLCLCVGLFFTCALRPVHLSIPPPSLHPSLYPCIVLPAFTTVPNWLAKAPQQAGGDQLCLRSVAERLCSWPLQTR